MRPISRESARGVDRHAVEALHIPSLCLMESAGCGAATLALQGLYGDRRSVVVAAGPGNNGGDGMVVARHLAVAGVSVKIVLLPLRDGVPATEDARVQHRIVRAMRLETVQLAHDAGAAELANAERACAQSALVIDALFGTGLVRPLEGVARGLVEALNRSGAGILALDLPSGLDCDTGEPLGACVRAARTATFVAPKQGFTNPASRAYTGTVCVIPIGAPREWPGA